MHTLTWLLRCIFLLQSSDGALLVVFELHDERLNVLALVLPFWDGSLSVGVEVLLLLVKKGLGLQRINLALLELSHSRLILYSRLLGLESLQLLSALSFFLTLLLLSNLQLFVAHLPEFCELHCLLLCCSLCMLLSLDLQLSGTLNSSPHIKLAFLILLKQTISTVLGLSDLSVENFLLIVL